MVSSLFGPPRRGHRESYALQPIILRQENVVFLVVVFVQLGVDIGLLPGGRDGGQHALRGR